MSVGASEVGGFGGGGIMEARFDVDIVMRVLDVGMGRFGYV